MVEKGSGKSRGIVEIVLLTVVIVALAVGGYFIWQSMKVGKVQKPTSGGQANLQTSGEVEVIEQDLGAADTSSVEVDLSSIEKEIDTALSE